MVPEFPMMRPLVLGDYAALARALAPADTRTCDLVPANLFIWRDSETTSITRVGDSLCVLVEPRSEPAYFLEPLGGARRADVVRVCLGRVDRISRAGKELVESLSPLEFHARPLRDHFDYVYRTEELAELKGKKFDGKRSHIRKFARNCPDYEFRPLGRSLFPAALKLFDRWAERQDVVSARAESPASLDPVWQRCAVERAFEAFDRLGLLGGAMMVRGELQGFVVASTDPGRGAVVHFQYANADVPGIYQMLLLEACRRLFTGCPWVNLEEDLGLPGLRRTKLSYQPCRLEQKFEIRKAQVEPVDTPLWQLPAKVFAPALPEQQGAKG